MMVEVRMSCDEVEHENFYEGVEDNNTADTGANDDTADANNDTAHTFVPDPAVIAVSHEDLMFLENMNLIDITGDQVDCSSAVLCCRKFERFKLMN